MYCPNCGKENLREQHFCRACGLSLLTISQALTDELSAADGVSSSVALVNREQAWWQSPVLYGFLIIILGLILAIFGKMILVEKLVADIGIIIALVGVGLLGLKGVLLMLPPTKIAPTPEAQLIGEPMRTLPTASPAGDLVRSTAQTDRTPGPAYNENKST